MDSNSPLIQAKVSKIDTSLSDLKNEISKCSVHLEKLKEDSETLVGKLNGISTPALYLQEFVGVNSLLLKYISLLTEINCKFEVLEILESGNGISKSNKDHHNNVSQVFKQPTQPEMNSSFENGLGLSENVNGRDSDQCNSDKERPQSKGLEGKVLTDERSAADDVKKNVGSVLSDVVKSQPHEKCSNEISDQPPSVSLQKKSCEPAQKKLNFDGSEHNTSNDPANHSIREIEVIKQPKTLSHVVQKTDPAVQMNETVNNQTVGVKDKDKDQTPICFGGGFHIDEIRPFEIPESLGKEFDARITEIISPSLFYVQLTDPKLTKLPELEKELKAIAVENRLRGEGFTHYKENSLAKGVAFRKLGSYALHYSKADDMFYRVKVTDWCLDCDTEIVHIYFLDYGESALTSLTSLHPMSKHLAEYPAFALRCHLSGIRPLNGDEEKPFHWDGKVTIDMMTLFIKSKNVKIKIVSSDTSYFPESLPVLVWMTDGRDECLNKLLVEKNLAKALDVSDDGKVCDDLKTIEMSDNKRLKEEEDEEEEEQLEKWNPMKEDYESYLNSYEVDINNPAAVIYGYVDKDSKRVCPQYAKTGKCYKGNTCGKQHMTLDPFGLTRDKEEVYKNAFNLLTPPSVNSIIRVLVTSVVDVNQFYCIAHYQVENSEESLYTLVDYINESKNVREMKKLLIPPSIGQVVLAKYSQDDCWYRAKVLVSEPESDRFSLIFVDYGNKETVPLSSIRAIEPRYLHLPFQGMQCFIHGVGRNPEACQEDVMKYLNERLLDKDLKIEVVSQFPGDEVSLLVNVFDQNGTDIGKDLITQKYGVEKEDVLLNADCGRLPG